MLKTDFKFGEVMDLSSQVRVDSENVQFKSIFENGKGGVSLLAFRKGQKLSTHLAPAEVMVYVMDGEIEFTLPEETKRLKSGDFMLVGEGVAHSVSANVDSKVMLVKVKSTRK